MICFTKSVSVKWLIEKYYSMQFRLTIYIYWYFLWSSIIIKEDVIYCQIETTDNEVNATLRIWFPKEYSTENKIPLFICVSVILGDVFVYANLSRKDIRFIKRNSDGWIIAERTPENRCVRTTIEHSIVPRLNISRWTFLLQCMFSVLRGKKSSHLTLIILIKLLSLNVSNEWIKEWI